MSRYKINGIEYTSPTQVLGLLSTGDALIYWAVNLALKHNDKNAWKTKRDQTADVGSELHNLIETYINIQLKHKNNADTIKILLKDSNYNLKQMFYQFYNWQKKNVKEFLESESQVLHELLCYAGTVDFIYKDFDNNICLIDLKTSNAIYDKAKFQISAYKEARESMQSKKYVINGNNNGREYQKILLNTPRKIDKIGILKISRDFFDLEYIDYTKNHVLQFEAFLGLLKYYYCSAKRRLNNHRAKSRA